MVRKSLAFAIALAFAAMPGVGRADAVSDLQAQVDALQRQIDALKAKLEQVTTQVQTEKVEQEKKNEQFLARKPPG
jgi:predicted  nucleic acid-binding Zn-ribbon protein